MCERYSFVVEKKKLEDQFSLKIEELLHSSFNIGPTNRAPVILNLNPSKIEYITWGLIPQTSRDGKNTGTLINARKEGISGSSSFRLPIRQKRCIILADSFYEWKQEGIQKIPYRILLKDKSIIAMAGIWTEWTMEDYSEKSFSIITAPSNKEMSEVYNRMPVILSSREKQEAWLKDIPLNEVLSLLETMNDNTLKIYKIAGKINDRHYNKQDLHQILNEPPPLF